MSDPELVRQHAAAIITAFEGMDLNDAGNILASVLLTLERNAELPPGDFISFVHDTAMTGYTIGTVRLPWPEAQQ